MLELCAKCQRGTAAHCVQHDCYTAQAQYRKGVRDALAEAAEAGCEGCSQGIHLEQDSDNRWYHVNTFVNPEERWLCDTMRLEQELLGGDDDA